MRMPPATNIERTCRSSCIEPQTVDVEIPVLEADVEIRRHRVANACHCLPGQPALAASAEVPIDRRNIKGFVNASHAHASSDEPCKAVIVTEICKAVHHCGDRAGMAAGVVIGRVGKRNSGVDVDVLHASALVTNLAFQPEHPEVIPADQVHVVPDMMMQSVGSPYADSRIGVVIIGVLLDHRSALEPYVWAVVASNGGCRECCRGKGNRNGKFAHGTSPVCATPDWSNL